MRTLFNGEKRTVPAGSWELIGRVMQHPFLFGAYHVRAMTQQLGAKVPNSPTSDGVKARDNHGAMRTLLHVVATMEADLQPTNDRPDYYRRVNSLMGNYISYLQPIGYTPARIECVLTGELTTEQVLAEETGASHDPSETSSAEDTDDDSDTEDPEPVDPQDLDHGDEEDTSDRDEPDSLP